MKYVYTITKDAAGKSYWNKIGVAFENKDGSLNGRLFGLPVSGEFQIRDYTPPEERQPRSELPKTRTKDHGSPPDDDDIPFA